MPVPVCSSSLSLRCARKTVTWRRWTYFNKSLQLLRVPVSDLPPRPQHVLYRTRSVQGGIPALYQLLRPGIRRPQRRFARVTECVAEVPVSARALRCAALILFAVHKPHKSSSASRVYSTCFPSWGRGKPFFAVVSLCDVAAACTSANTLFFRTRSTKSSSLTARPHHHVHRDCSPNWVISEHASMLNSTPMAMAGSVPVLALPVSGSRQQALV